MTSITGAAASAASPIATATASQPSIGKEFNSFIKLLIAQMRNQDPLAPTDSTQFVEQLATFSSLEQQVNSNTQLGSIASMMNNLTGIMTGQVLGQTVSLQSSWLPYAGEPIEFIADLPAGTTRSVLSIRDQGGQTVWTETLPPGTALYTWDGRATAGGQAPAGELYEFSIDAYSLHGQYTGSIAPRVRG
jgi:flagellar basal-body rod modification protein FlgD